MKQLIMYYSFSGSNKILAEYIHLKTKFKIIQITEMKKRNSLTFMVDLIRKKPIQTNINSGVVSGYDFVYIIAPTWFGKIAKPVLSAIAELSKCQIPYSIITLRGGTGDDINTIQENIKITTNHSPIEIYDFHVCDYCSTNTKDVTKMKLSEPSIHHIGDLWFQQSKVI